MACIRGSEKSRGSTENLSVQTTKQEKSIVQIYTDWANHYLERGRFKRYIQDLQVDVSDGVLLADVIEAVTGNKVPDVVRKPKGPCQMIENINVCLSFLSNLGVRLDGVTAKDIKDGSLKDILSLFFSLSRYKQAQKAANSTHNHVRNGNPAKPSLAPSGVSEMSKLPSPFKQTANRTSAQSAKDSSSIPVPSIARRTNQIEKSSVPCVVPTNMTGSSGLTSKTPSTNNSRSGSPHGSTFIPQPKSTVLTRDRTTNDKSQSRPSSTSSSSSLSHLPVKAPSAGSARNQTASSPKNSNNSMLDKFKLFNSKDRPCDGGKGIVSKRTSSSSGFSSARSEKSDSSTSICSEPKLTSTPDAPAVNTVFPAVNNQEKQSGKNLGKKPASKTASNIKDLPQKYSYSAKEGGKLPSRTANKQSGVRNDGEKKHRGTNQSQIKESDCQQHGSILPENQFRQSKISSLANKSSRGTPDNSAVQDNNSQNANTGIPKPTAAVKGTTKSSKALREPRTHLETTGCARGSRDDTYVAIKIARSNAQSESPQYQSSSLPKPDRHKTERNQSEATQAIAMVSPIVCTKTPSVLEATVCKSRPSPNLSDITGPKETMDAQTNQSLAEEAEDVMVNIKPMQPLTRLHGSSRESPYGYTGRLGPWNSNRKMPMPSGRLQADLASPGTRLAVNKQLLITQDSSRIYGIPARRPPPIVTNSNSEGDYATADTETIDIGAGYMSDGDVLRTGSLWRPDDIASGYMSEGGVSLYIRKAGSRPKESQCSNKDSVIKTINVLQDDSSIKTAESGANRGRGFDDSSSLSSGISDTIAELSTDDNLTGSSVSSDNNPYGSLKRTSREDNAKFENKDSRQNSVASGDHHSRSSSAKLPRSGNVKKTDSSMQTESSAFHQMSSSSWKKYLQQQHESRHASRESRSPELIYERTKDSDVNRNKEKRSGSSSSLASPSRKGIANGGDKTDCYRKHKTSVLKQSDLDYFSEGDNYSDGGSPRLGKGSCESLPQTFRGETARKAQDLRSAAIAATNLVHVSSKRPTSTSSLSSNGSTKCSKASSTSKGPDDNESNQYESLDIIRNPMPSMSRFGSNGNKSTLERKGKMKIGTNTPPSHDIHNLGLGAHSDSEYCTLEKKHKQFPLTSPTLSLRDRLSANHNSDYVILSRDRNPRIYKTTLDNDNYVNLEPLATTGPYSCTWIRHSTSPSTSAPNPRTYNGLPETESMDSISSAPVGTHGQVASSYYLPSSPVSASLPSSHGRSSGGSFSHYMAGLLSKVGNKEDELHGSALSLVSNTSSIYSTAEEKQAHEIRKLRKELDQANDKVSTLTCQLTTNIEDHLSASR